jgi:hypothetical protein
MSVRKAGIVDKMDESAEGQRDEFTRMRTLSMAIRHLRSSNKMRQRQGPQEKVAGASSIWTDHLYLYLEAISRK